jgi:hypothetical protein
MMWIQQECDNHHMDAYAIESSFRSVSWLGEVKHLVGGMKPHDSFEQTDVFVVVVANTPGRTHSDTAGSSRLGP